MVSSAPRDCSAVPRSREAFAGYGDNDGSRWGRHLNPANGQPARVAGSKFDSFDPPPKHVLERAAIKVLHVLGQPVERPIHYARQDLVAAKVRGVLA